MLIIIENSLQYFCNWHGLLFKIISKTDFFPKRNFQNIKSLLYILSVYTIECTIYYKLTFCEVYMIPSLSYKIVSLIPHAINQNRFSKKTAQTRKC